MDKHNRYLYFHTFDYAGVPTTSGFSLPVTPFKFIPVFDDGTPEVYSEQNIMWDFGDGTTSKELTGYHYYKLPGWYDVKCYFLGTGGKGYVDSFSQSIMVRDYISDTLVLSSKTGATNEAGLPQSPYTVIRFNSWQTYPFLSADGYTVNLQVSGNTAKVLDTTEYNKDKWGHLKPSARFTTELFNKTTEQYEYLPVNSLQTSSTEIYVHVLSGDLKICSPNAVSATFAGTSGTKDFYYIDDLPRISNEDQKSYSSTVFISFDTRKFKDNDSYGKDYGDFIYNTLNSVYDTAGFSKTIGNIEGEQFKLTISSNGMDDDNAGEPLSTFNIDPYKYSNQKIPFIVRYKNEIPIYLSAGVDYKEFPLKYFGLLGLATQTNEITGNNVQLVLKDSFHQIIPEAEFFTAFGELSSETYGGFLKGYLTCSKEVENVYIDALGLPTIIEQFFAETTYAAIGEPASEKLHNLRIRTDVEILSVKTLEDDLVDITGLSGVYTTCITTKRDSLLGENVSYMWLGDSDSDKIRKYDPSSMTLLNEYSLYNNFGILSGSISNIAGDDSNNVWVTLYDSVSTIKIGDATNSIDAVIVPSLANGTFEDENTLAPASVDVDISGNVWVSYSTELSSFVEKYSSSGGFIKHVTLSANYQTTELICDTDGNTWVILKELTNDIPLSAFDDKVAKIDSTGNTVTYYNVGGSLHNIAFDNLNNIWITRNRNEVARINSLTSAITAFSLSSNSLDSPLNYISDLEGIACQSDNTIIVIDNYNRVLHYFNAEESDHIQEGILPLAAVGIVSTSNKINGYGDWNGYRNISKFCKSVGVTTYRTGRSNNFSIFSPLSGRYDIRKVNEDFGPIEQIKSYRHQPYLKDANRFFDDYIGTSVGSKSDSPNVLGKRIYEKIANFTDNISNVDTCNVDALKAMYELLDEDIASFHGSDLNIPANLYRLIDMFSVNLSKLKGTKNKFNQDFDDKGFDNDGLREKGLTPNYGVNKGSEIDFFTGVLTTSAQYIVSYEKFSEKYRLLNINLSERTTLTYQNSAAKTYSLSSYHPDWGWNLILPDNYQLSSYLIPRYYTFFQYISTTDDRYSGNLINWRDTNNTISQTISSTTEWNDIRQSMISYALAKGLEVI